jgi:hypothetical protein
MCGQTWPRWLSRFNAMPELDQCKKMMDMEGFIN